MNVGSKVCEMRGQTYIYIYIYERTTRMVFWFGRLGVCVPPMCVHRHRSLLTRLYAVRSTSTMSSKQQQCCSDLMDRSGRDGKGKERNEDTWWVLSSDEVFGCLFYMTTLFVVRCSFVFCFVFVRSVGCFGSSLRERERERD